MKACKPIRVWPFSEAPKRLQRRSTHGGDEDWVILIPRDLASGDVYRWWETGPIFGDYSIQRETLGDGSLLVIAAHA